VTDNPRQTAWPIFALIAGMRADGGQCPLEDRRDGRTTTVRAEVTPENHELPMTSFRRQNPHDFASDGRKRV
jgi:hypothetical protein